MHPEPLPAQGTQRHGKPCGTNKIRLCEKGTPTFEKTHLSATLKKRLIEKTPEIVSFTAVEKTLEHTLHATHCTDRTPTSTTAVPERPSSFDVIVVCAKCTRTRRYERKSTKQNVLDYTASASRRPALGLRGVMAASPQRCARGSVGQGSCRRPRPKISRRIGTSPRSILTVERKMPDPRLPRRSVPRFVLRSKTIFLLSTHIRHTLRTPILDGQLY